MKNFQQNLQKLEAADTQVLGVSMDSPFANRAFADQIGVTFPLGKDGKIVEEQIDKDAIDPTKIVDACQRPKMKQ